MNKRTVILTAVIVFAIGVSSALAQAKHIVGKGVLGCIDKKYHEKLAKYSSQGDQAALVKGIKMGLITGQCVAFEPGEAVHIEDTAIFSGLVKIRRPGETESYWTNFEAVK